MIPFETHLLEKGWDKYQYDFEIQDLVLSNDKPHLITPTKNLCYIYKKDNKEITIGFGERNKPVAILFPYLYFKHKNMVKPLSHIDMMNLANEYKDDYPGLIDLLFSKVDLISETELAF